MPARTKKARAPKAQAKRRSPNRGRTFPPEILTPEEIRAMIRAASNRAPTGVRNRALLVTLYRAGLRISEALALEPKDVDPDAGTVRVLHGKGDKPRTVAVAPEAFAVIQRWLDRRAALKVGRTARIFCTLDGRPVQASYVRALLPRLARRAGIEKRVHAHGFRHTFAAELAAEGIPLNVIQVALGHSNAATTSRYLQHVAPTQVINTLRARTWKA